MIAPVAHRLEDFAQSFAKANVIRDQVDLAHGYKLRRPAAMLRKSGASCAGRSAAYKPIDRVHSIVINQISKEQEILRLKPVLYVYVDISRH